VAHDVEEARSKLNFSEWNRPRQEADEAVELVLEGEMPPLQYAIMHKAAQLDDSERQALADGLRATNGGE